MERVSAPFSLLLTRPCYTAPTTDDGGGGGGDSYVPPDEPTKPDGSKYPTITIK